MGFEAAVVTCFRKYAVFRGRASRSEFWWFYLLFWTASLAVSLLTVAFGNAPVAAPIVAIINMVVRLGLLVPLLATAVRRLHDLDKTGWWLVAPVAAVIPAGIVFTLQRDSSDPTLNFIALIWSAASFILGLVLLRWFCSRGTPGENRFGPDTLAGLREPESANPSCTNCGSQCQQTIDGILFCGGCGAVYQPTDFKVLACPACGAHYRPADYRKGELWTCSSCSGPLPQAELQPVVGSQVS